MQRLRSISLQFFRSLSFCFHFYLYFFIFLRRDIALVAFCVRYPGNAAVAIVWFINYVISFASITLFRFASVFEQLFPLQAHGIDTLIFSPLASRPMEVTLTIFPSQRALDSELKRNFLTYFLRLVFLSASLSFRELFTYEIQTSLSLNNLFYNFPLRRRNK